jgi:hypothetical protein
VEDETHFLFECPLYVESRVFFLFRYMNEKCPNLQLLNNHNKLVWLMTNEDTDIVNKFVDFIQNNYNLRKVSTTNI